MALVVLAFDGIGLGHLRRAEIVSRAAARLGRPPRLFVQGWCPPSLAERFEVTSIARVWEMSDGERGHLVRALEGAALDGTEPVLVEDTHPSGLRLDRRVRRHLVVRPTTFEHLLRLEREQARDYDRIFLADHPESPTWPYDAAQTEAIRRWGWEVLGPLHHGGRPEVPWRQRPATCVLSVGGGGEHPGREDLDVYVRHAEMRIASIRRIDPQARFPFHPGPYFPARLLPPRGAEPAGWSDLPRVLGWARAALVRPGFNTLWECLRAGTPFEVVPTRTWNEPVVARLARLARFVPPVHDLAAAWEDVAFLVATSERLVATAAPWDGEPPAHLIAALAAA